MAVFSKVTQETLQNLLSNFNIGELLYFEGIQAGIENTNYFIYTSENTYVLTIFEKYFALAPTENLPLQEYSISIFALCKNLYFNIP